MQHPFAGVIIPHEPNQRAPHRAHGPPAEAPRYGRRSFFAAACGALGGALAFVWTGKARAQQPRVEGAEANEPDIFYGPGSRGRTPARRIDRGKTPAVSEPGFNRPQRPTTKALGEEGGDGAYTTYALGEEGSGGSYTTYALGEEGAGGATTYALGEEGGGGWRTTYALGEEGGGRSRWNNGNATTYALGEEGGGYPRPQDRRPRRRYRTPFRSDSSTTTRTLREYGAGR